MRKQDNQLYLKIINNQYKDTHQLTVEYWENQVYPLTVGKEVKIDPSAKNDS